MTTLFKIMPSIAKKQNIIPVVRRSCRLLVKTLTTKKDFVDNDSGTLVKIKRLFEEESSKNKDLNQNVHKRIKIEYINDIPTIGNNKIKLDTDIIKNETCDNKYTITSSSYISQTNPCPKPDGYIEVDCEELDLERTLLGGQSFRWVKEKIDDNNLVFTGVILNHVVKLWRISDSRIAYKKLNKNFNNNNYNMEEILADYFQLKYNLKELYENWSRKDANVAKCCEQYKGFRILRQDPVENVFSFICATNNNIKRISQMVEKLCKRYGDILEVREDEPTKSIYDSYHSFPPAERLAQEDVFQCLRYELGFGYRAKFINETAKELMRIVKNQKESKISPREYLLSLRNLPYKENCKQLMRFQGIGRKVADCICLMSMDHLDSVPIDCHIYEIVCRNYMPNLRNERKTLTDSVHDLIGNYFKDLHGNLAGWSTSVLFIAELKHLKLQKDDPTKGNDKKKKKKY